MPELTLGIPMYNAMPFLPETISSLLTQDYHDFNILIIDDGSTDESSQYLKTVKDNRLRVIRQENKGIIFTRNRLLQETRTPWLVLLDHDDIAYPNRIRLVMEYIRKYPGAGMFYSMAKYHGSKNVGTFRTTIATPAVLRNLTKAGYLLAICQSTVTLNVRKVLDTGGYTLNLSGVEDVDLFWRLALNSEIIFIPEVTTGFRLNFSTVSSKGLLKQSIDVIYVQYLLLSHLWGLSPLADDEVRNHLPALLDKKHLQFRENIRKVNIYASGKDYIRASAYAAKSLLTSPGHFIKRLTYELGSKEIAVNGIDPRIFAGFSHNLWKDMV
ncbi:MAG: glycosyltransferase [Nitrospirae bacterium]|nr:glycosyltransferase [Nitrospirota bacterium]